MFPTRVPSRRFHGSVAERRAVRAVAVALALTPAVAVATGCAPAEGQAAAEIVLDWSVPVDGPRVLMVVLDGRRIVTDTLAAGGEAIDTLTVRTVLPVAPGERELRVSFDPLGVMGWSGEQRAAAFRDTTVVPPLQLGRRLHLERGEKVTVYYDAGHRFLQTRSEGE